MSWTSEHDPPSSRIPDDEPSALAGLDEAPASNGDDPVDGVDALDDDGPLDPSVFDGLFDDLANDEPDEVEDNPLDEFLSITLTGDIDEDAIEAATAPPPVQEARDADGSFATVETDLNADAGPNPDGDLNSDLDLDLGSEVDHSSNGEAQPDGGFGIDAGDLAFGGDDLDALGRPLPPAMPTREDEAAAGLIFTDSTDEPEFGQLDDADPDETVAFFDSLTEPNSEVEPELERADPDRAGFDSSDVDLDETVFDEPALFDSSGQDLDDIEDLDGFGRSDEFEPTDDFDEFEESFDEPFEETDVETDDGVDLGPFAAAPAYEDGPVRASPPIQQDPYPEAEYVPAPPVEEEPVPQVVIDPRVKRSRRVLVALMAAIVVGGGLGIGGAMVLSRLVNRGDSVPATAAATGADEDIETAAAAEQVTSGDDITPLTSLQIASLRFDAGDATQSIVASPALDLLASAIDREPSEPIVATVRTFTEVSAADDLALSRRQAEALTAQLIELGADPTRVAVVGLGRSLLSGAQPVPNFLVPSAGLDSSELSEVAQRIGPFAIGIDPTTGQLRAESLNALDELAQAMAADPEGRGLTLAAYSFDQSDRAGNERQAQLVVDAATARLAEAGIDPARLATIVAGDEPFAVPDRVANHIDLHWGTGAATQLALSTLAIDQIDFAEGSSELGPQATATVDQLATVLIESGADAVIDVHSFDGGEVQARVDLSVLRAQAIGQRLLAAGVPAAQLRLHGGTSAQFRDEGRVCRVVVTVLQPPDQS